MIGRRGNRCEAVSRPGGPRGYAPGLPAAARGEASGRCAAARGQASVEVVAMLPLLAVVAAAVLQLLSAGLAAELADHAAEAGAVALVQKREPRQAVRDALPGWSRRRVAVAVRGRTVEVRLRPPALTRSLARLLTAKVRADAGPGS